jgi:hypothetical protein
MVRTTREQRQSIKKLYQRMVYGDPAVTYRTLRERIQPTIGCDGAVVIQCMGMFLCIERDGYTHS